MGNEIIGDDDVFIVENLEPQDKIANDKKLKDRVKIEDEIIRLDDCSIDIGVG
jgi:hypothetical protein